MLVIFNEDICKELNNLNYDLMKEIRKLGGWCEPFNEFINIEHNNYGTVLYLSDVYFKFKHFKIRFFFQTDNKKKAETASATKPIGNKCGENNNPIGKIVGPTNITVFSAFLN